MAKIELFQGASEFFDFRGAVRNVTDSPLFDRRQFVLSATAGLCAGCASIARDQEERLASLLQPALARGYPSVAFLVQKPNARPRLAAVGSSDLLRHTPMRPDTPFHIASITKTFTAVAVLKLVDEQRLSLDASLLQLLHADVILRIANAERVTIRQLLDHTSGIYATNNDLAYLTTVIGPNADPLLVWTPEEIVALADRARSRPLGEPGEAHFYSDTNYVLLSMIVAGIAGIPFKKYVTDRIFYPLAMNDTYYYSDRLPVRGLANVKTTHGYLLATEEIRNLIDINRMYEAIPGVQREGVSLLDVTLASERIDGASGIVSTLPDLNRFAKALFGGGLLSDSSQSFLMSVGTGMQDEPLDRRRICALRALRKEFGALIFAEGDSPGGVNTLLAYAPASQTIYAGVVNMFGSFDEVDWMTDDVIAKLDAR